MPSDSLGPWSLAMPPPGPPVKVPRKTVLLLPLLMAKCSGSAGGLQSLSARANSSSTPRAAALQPGKAANSECPVLTRAGAGYQRVPSFDTRTRVLG